MTEVRQEFGALINQATERYGFVLISKIHILISKNRNILKLKSVGMEMNIRYIDTFGFFYQRCINTLLLFLSLNFIDMFMLMKNK